MRAITIGKDRIPTDDIIAVEPYTPDISSPKIISSPSRISE